MLSPSTERAQDQQLNHLHLRLPCDSAAPRMVRHALNQMPDLDDVRDDALLIASELVTNAVMHSGGREDEVVEVWLERGHDSLLISVLDPGVDGGVAEVELHDRAHGGWGLRVVEQLARRWGRERGEGYRVWAELAL